MRTPLIGCAPSSIASIAPRQPDPGRVTARRLNRAEYNYTIHDLLGVDFRPADGFPQDDAGYGFDNNGDVLSLSITQMEKYLAAAETVARRAVYGPAVGRSRSRPATSRMAGAGLVTSTRSSSTRARTSR